MFVNCPHCRTLVATDPATDLPPAFCPECAGPLRGGAAEGRQGEAPARREAGEPQASPVTEHSGPHRDSWWDEAAARVPADSPSSPAEAEPAEAAPADAAGSAPSGRAAASPDASSTDDEANSDSAPAPGASAPALAAARVAPLRGSLPGFLHRRGTAPARRDWRAPAAVVGLGLLLVLQVLLADRDRLAAQAGWRPLLTALCAGLGCDLPPWREPTAFTLLQRDVRQHPTRPGALRVSATFRNDARWPQPWPRLQLSLADADGRTAGVRSFTAEEYLGGPPAQAELASGETATVAMDILEPAPDIVAFDFGFR